VASSLDSDETLSERARGMARAAMAESTRSRRARSFAAAAASARPDQASSPPWASTAGSMTLLCSLRCALQNSLCDGQSATWHSFEQYPTSLHALQCRSLVA
jgi:hypothetical protein